MTTTSISQTPSLAAAPRPAAARRERGSVDDLLGAGAGSGLILVQLSAIIPGLLPTLGLLGLITAVAVLPALLIGLALTLLLAPPYGVWRLATRGRRRRRAEYALTLAARH